MSHLVILDNEAVQALRDPAHPKHRRVVAYVQVIAARTRRAVLISTAVPTTVRVEAGWDRTSPAWAFPNKLRITDHALDTSSANISAAIRSHTGVTVADAHLGALIQTTPAAHVTVVTSDPADMRLVARDKHVTIAAI